MAEITTTQTMGNKTITTTINTAARGPAGSDANVTAANTLTALQAMTIVQEISARAAIGTGQTWVFEGDSWTAGTAQGNDRETFPYYLAILGPPDVEIVNVALAGVRAETMVSTFAATVAPSLTATTGKLSTCFIFAGINDAATRTTTQLRDDLRSLWTAARAAGARVVAFTLPNRTAAAGWSEADWRTINAQIIADSSYWDVLVRTDIFASNGVSADYTDGLHVSTAAHKKLAAQVLRAMRGETVQPGLLPDSVANQAVVTTLTSGTRKNLGFLDLFDNNNDMGSFTVGSDANTSVFTVPVDGTYIITGGLLVGGFTAADTMYLQAWIKPYGGAEAEHRIKWVTAAGANEGIEGTIRRRLSRGDTVNLAIISSRTGSSLLTNANFSVFSVKLESIP
jgi:lysophospholipase L1-like esterase